MSDDNSIEITDTHSDGLDIYTSQLRDVEDMRSQLLSIDRRDPGSARKALQNITVLRVYHQISRIIRYTELMDRIEDKMYQSIDAQLDQASPDDAEAWRVLINLQTRLQDNMIQSHKLLEPYLNLETLNFANMAPDETVVDADAMVLDKDSRERLRNSAQEVLQALQQNSDSKEKIVSDNNDNKQEENKKD